MEEIEKIYYKEEQRFKQRWLLLLIGSLAVLSTFGFIKQIVFKIPFGDKPMSDYGLIVFWVFNSLVMPCLLYSLRLITLVKADGVYCCFYFLIYPIRKKILFTNIRRYEARIYSPILEYGGWGIRNGAYNVSGDKGVQFELIEGKPILIGTQKPEEFLKAIDEAMGKCKGCSL